MTEGRTIYMNNQSNDFLFRSFSEGFGGGSFLLGEGKVFKKLVMPVLRDSFLMDVL